MKYFIVLSLFFAAVSCRHHDRKVTVIERVQAPNGQSASELLRSAADQTNYGGSEAAQLLNAAAGGQGQQPQFTQEQIVQLQKLLAQQQAERQNQPPQLGLGGPSAAEILGAAVGNQNLGYNSGSRLQNGISSGQQLPNFGLQQQQVDLGQGLGLELNQQQVGQGLGINQGLNQGFGINQGLGQQLGLGQGQRPQVVNDKPKRTDVWVPFFFNMGLDKSGNQYEKNTKMKLSSMGGLVQVNLDRTTDVLTGKKSGPVDVYVGGLRMAG